MSGTKNLSTYIVEKCKQNPRFAFVLIPMGAFLAYFGLADAKFYQSLRDKPVVPMKVELIYEAPNSRGFFVPHVAGTTPQGEVSFSISDKEARQFHEGQELQIIETNDPNRLYVTRDTLNEQLAEIRFSVAGFPVNTIVLLGSAIALGGLAWGLFAKPKLTESVDFSLNDGGPSRTSQSSQ
jgi:hypothetical protein